MVAVIEPRLLHEDAFDRLRSSTQRTTIVARHGAGKTSLVARLLDADPELIGVQVPKTVDRVERTILELSAFGGAAVQDAVACELERNMDDPERALEVLDTALAGRRLIVDDFHELLPSAFPPELSDLLGSPSRALSAWLTQHATVITTTAPLHDVGFEENELDTPGQPPWSVRGRSNECLELWSASRGDIDLYRASLTRWLLHRGPPTPDELSNADTLTSIIWESTPGPVQRVMATLACYGSSFPAEQFERLVGASDIGDWALTYAQDTLLIERSKHWYWLSPLWRTRVPRLIERHVSKQTHRDLAEFFAKATRDATILDPRWIQAAHRHYLNAGDLSLASEYLRFGVGLLLDTGQRASRARKYTLAAEYYDTILRLDERIRPNTADGIGTRSRGYARHYYHYNRYKGGVETINRTEAGYQRSVDEYPENALFWSRLIVARFQQDRWGDAMRTYTHANETVTSAPARERHLLGRTVTKLLGRHLDNAAVVIWGDASDVSDPRAVEASYGLGERGAGGWTTRVLRIPDLPDTVFERPVLVEITTSRGDARCNLKDARVTGRGSSMLAALRDAVEWLRSETAESLLGHADEFGPNQRMRRRELLGLVDVIESEIKGPGPEFHWMVGELVERESLGRVFCPHGAHEGEFYELEPGLQVPDSATGTFEAKLRSGRGGAPRGPVVELEPLFATQAELDAAREELEQLLGKAGS